MSIQDKISNAKPTTWLTDGMTDVEKAVMEERVKWLKVVAAIKTEIIAWENWFKAKEESGKDYYYKAQMQYRKETCQEVLEAEIEINIASLDGYIELSDFGKGVRGGLSKALEIIGRKVDEVTSERSCN